VTLVCLGNLIVDDIVFADGRTRLGEPGGAMLYTALGASLWGARVAIVAPVGTDYPRATLAALAARGVDLSGLRTLTRPGLRAWLRYEPDGRRVEHQAGSPTHDEASPRADDLVAFADARAFHLAPAPRTCQARLVEALSQCTRAFVSLDPHDPVTEASLGDWRDVLARVDLLFLSEEEARLPSLAPDPATALHALAGGRLGAVALKRGERGGVYVDLASGATTPWPARTHVALDATGAGDAFAGGFLAGWPDDRDLGAALTRGVVAASFALETMGARGLLDATRAEAQRRFDAWREAFAP